MQKLDCFFVKGNHCEYFYHCSYDLLDATIILNALVKVLWEMDSYYSRSIWWLVCHNLFSSFFLPGWSELPKLSGNIILMAILTTVLAITLIIILIVTLMIRLLFVHYALNKWRVIDRNNPLFLLLFPTNSSIALL